MPRTVEIVAPSRLHFGLFAFGEGERRYGGVGAMIAEPSLRLRAAAAPRFSASGHYLVRAGAFAREYAKSFGVPEPPACRLEVVEAPDEHHGLGLGTQLGMAIGAALAAIEGRDELTAAQLAVAVGRGARSAVGAHGFRHGGLIVDGGKTASEPIGRLDARVALPDAWRFVLVRPPAAIGLAGKAEIDAFRQVLPPPVATTERLRCLAMNELAPAAEAAEFDRFSAALHDYNVTAGECFAAVQGGPFANNAVAEVVALMQTLGCVGCGQSSWGPTVFGVVENDDAATRLVEQLATQGIDALSVAPSNTGALIRVVDGIGGR